MLPSGPACRGQWSVCAWLAHPEGARSFIPKATSRHPKCVNPGPSLARLPRDSRRKGESRGSARVRGGLNRRSKGTLWQRTCSVCCSNGGHRTSHLSKPLERTTLRVAPTTLRTLGDADCQHGLVNCNQWIAPVGDNRGGCAHGGRACGPSLHLPLNFCRDPVTAIK